MQTQVAATVERQPLPAPELRAQFGKSLSRTRSVLLPASTIAAGLLFWWGICASGWVSEVVLPSPVSTFKTLFEELRSGQLLIDTWASVFRIGAGFGLAMVLGIPLGLMLGHLPRGREALVPTLNFFRNLSPLTWIPFAILWFGIGDAPAIFLIFFATFFPLTITTMAAVANVPSVYFQLGREYGWSRFRQLFRVTLPAIAPQLITALRVTSGISWVVVVAAEMSAGKDGLGFLIWDARNGLRTDLLVAGMLTIGAIGSAVDLGLYRLTKLRSLRWGHGR